MKRLTKFFTIILFIAMPIGMTAQNETKSFDEFRNSILNNYNNYRSEILSQYGKYLDSLWVEYPQYAGVERNPFPKPKDVPVAKDATPPPTKDVPPTPEKTPGVGDTPSRPHKGETDPIINPNVTDEIEISFYGIPLTMHDEKYLIPDDLDKSSASDLWIYMYDNDLEKPIIKEIKRLANELNLNDYLIYELTNKYVETKFPNHTPFSRNTLKHFLLCNMGYDARLAETKSGIPLILLPFNQMVYARAYLKINNRNYFAFSETPFGRKETIFTCDLPSDLFLGNSFELKINGLKLPYKPYNYKINYGGITLTGEVNANIYPILYHYPQMPMGDYAQSYVSSEMRESIVSQLQNALNGECVKNKIEKLLQFTQYAFDYATDGENHGFEKPYFLEEIVYYPKCDCEDRAIFYSYLLYNVAGVENHIIAYPGHEATALTLPTEQLEGTSYEYDGKRFFISDPTYIGAMTGMCMPEFENEKPRIDYIYK